VRARNDPSCAVLLVLVGVDERLEFAVEEIN
jgi:hypothetical protein